MGSRLSGGTVSLRYADYSEWLPVFRVLTIENYGSVNSFNLPRNGYTYGAGKAHGFYNTTTAYNPPPSFSILWPIPALTIALLRNPIPGVTLDAGAIRNRGMTEIR